MLVGIGLVLPVFLLGVASAAPAAESSGDPKHHLLARHVIYHTSCNRFPKSNPKVSYKETVKKAFEDMATLSEAVLRGGPIIVDGKRVTYRESEAFKHYFDDADYDKVIRMHEVIDDSKLPQGGSVENRLHSYTYTVKCGSDQDEESCKNALAATSFDPKEPVMILCDQFFDPKTEQTNKHLDSKEWKTKRGAWCQPGVKFPFFSVAGLTLYHEITHLDLVGRIAGLPEREEKVGKRIIKSHGTNDVYALAEKSKEDKPKYYRGKIPMSPYDASRQLKIYWDAWHKDHKKYEPKLPIIENAESYAASALEYYVQFQCHWLDVHGEV